jgi:hypothetical protein
MKISIKKYLLYSSVFAIFTEAFFFNFIIDWKLLYLIIIVNYFLLLKIKKITLNIYFVVLLLFLLIHGLLMYTVISIPYNYMFSQIIGIAVIGTYYYNFVSLYKKEEIMNVYLKIALVVGVIGYPLYFLNINLNDGRLQSIFKEPAHYVIVIIPACYFYLKNKNYLNFSILFGTLILSNSSLGYVGCALMFILPNLTLKRAGILVVLMPIVASIFLFVYNEFPFFKLRVDDTYNSLNVINTGKFNEDTNLSSYVLISNLYIAKNNITDHPLGSGIGSHHYMHTKRYLKTMRPPEYLRKQNKEGANSFDANSLFTRICSEFGIIGFVFLVFVLYKTSKCFQSSDLYFAQGIYIYFLLKLFRDGTYFPPEFYLFIWLFYIYYKDNNKIKTY